MKKLAQLLFAVIIPFVFSCNAQESTEVTLITKAELEELLKNPEVQLIDVRTVSEVEAGKIAKSQNIVWDSNFSKKLDNLNKSKPVILYCKRGGRSAKAAEVLNEMGFEQIYDLKGGYDSYLKS